MRDGEGSRNDVVLDQVEFRLMLEEGTTGLQVCNPDKDVVLEQLIELCVQRPS